MTKLREQMIQDMVLRGMAPSTQRAYLQAVTKFARHYNRSPGKAVFSLAGRWLSET